eukprot:426719-Prymnesium_polylepis.2
MPDPLKPRVLLILDTRQVAACAALHGRRKRNSETVGKTERVELFELRLPNVARHAPWHEAGGHTTAPAVPGPARGAAGRGAKAARAAGGLGNANESGGEGGGDACGRMLPEVTVRSGRITEPCASLGLQRCGKGGSCCVTLQPDDCSPSLSDRRTVAADGAVAVAVVGTGALAGVSRARLGFSSESCRCSRWEDVLPGSSTYSSTRLDDAIADVSHDGVLGVVGCALAQMILARLRATKPTKAFGALCEMEWSEAVHGAQRAQWIGALPPDGRLHWSISTLLGKHIRGRIGKSFTFCRPSKGELASERNNECDDAVEYDRPKLADGR